MRLEVSVLLPVLGHFGKGCLMQGCNLNELNLCVCVCVGGGVQYGDKDHEPASMSCRGISVLSLLVYATTPLMITSSRIIYTLSILWMI